MKNTKASPNSPPQSRVPTIAKLAQAKMRAPSQVASAPPAYRPLPVPRVLQPRMARDQSLTNPTISGWFSNIVQRSQDKEYKKARRNWKCFVSYDAQSADLIERRLLGLPGINTEGKLKSKIENLMIEWRYHNVTIGHCSGDKSKKKNNNTDPVCEQIRTSFFNYLGIESKSMVKKERERRSGKRRR